VEVEADSFTAHLTTGAVVSETGGCLITSSNTLIDVFSAGAIGLDFEPPIPKVKQIRLGTFGHFVKSNIVGHRYLLRLIENNTTDLVENPQILTWPHFSKQVNLPPASRVALYTAGGSTEAFLHRLQKLVDPPNLVCIIDQLRRGVWHGLPIVPPEEINQRAIDYIIITSVPHYSAIRLLLEERGLHHLTHFSPVCFADQDIA
jgi:hypothetical protein